jgi:hypothetical protein
MPQLEQVVIEITQGEDFAAQIYWSDELGDPQSLTTPCRMDVRDTDNALVMQFKTGNTVASQATLVLSANAGFLQMSCPKEVTRVLQAGRYRFDLFVTANNGVQPFPAQVVPILEGWIDIQARTTILEA